LGALVLFFPEVESQVLLTANFLIKTLAYSLLSASFLIWKYFLILDALLGPNLLGFSSLVKPDDKENNFIN
jgi:hypothetical protein